jgi:hypothetical protein
MCSTLVHFEIIGIFFNSAQFAEFFQLQKMHLGNFAARTFYFQKTFFLLFETYRVKSFTISTLGKGLIHLTYVIFTKKKKKLSTLQKSMKRNIS